jgi:hypothetical protein
MATRPIFCPTTDGPTLVRTLSVEFKWYAGMAVSQRRLSIRSLHGAANAAGVSPTLEVSTKSEDPLGRDLSAFNLTVALGDGKVVPLEVAFQSAKVFEHGGPYLDMLALKPWEAKRDQRLRESGSLRSFQFGGEMWALEPKTAFYDWLYLTALRKKAELGNQLQSYRGFTDIEFNPEKSINCQARSVALFVALSGRSLVDSEIDRRESFLDVLARFGPLTAGTPAQREFLSEDPAKPS